MDRKEAVRKVGEIASRVVFGPKTVGIVELVKRDPNDRRYWHVLIHTDKGEKRHFTLPHRSIVYVQGEEMQFQEMPYVSGQHFDMQVRGTGFIPAPWNKIERDPFNLRSTK